jgi:phosphoribosylformylglycinamidine synthase
VGGEPIGLTDCLNFGNPERPEIMWQFAEACRGIAAACRELGVPVVSGNVSLYNETDGAAILPTPTVAIVGLLPDVTRRADAVFKREGDLIAVLGTTRGELGGSEYLKTVHDKLAGRPPALDCARELALQRLVRELIRDGRLSSAHDCSEGGLAVAIAECCIADPDRRIGARVRLEMVGVAPHAFLFGEDASRVVISFAPEQRAAVELACHTAAVPFGVIGTVGGELLAVEGHLGVPVPMLSKAYRSGIPAVLGAR